MIINLNQVEKIELEDDIYITFYFASGRIETVGYESAEKAQEYYDKIYRKTDVEFINLMD